ncbi:MAG TPA: hypothetical protein VF132_13060 [Rudaea sp.]
MKRVNQAIMAAVGLALAGSAFAAYDSYFDYARVTHVDRIVQQSDEPVTRQECWNEPRDMTRQTSVNEPTSDGYHTETATTTTTTRTYEQRCRTSTEYVQQPQQIAFDVAYRYGGQEYHDRMSHAPGPRVRVHVENGDVELAE